MAVAALKKFWNYLVGENDDDISEDVDVDVVDTQAVDEPDYVEDEPSTFSIFKGKNKVVSMSQAQPIKMKIIKPTNYDDVDEIISELKAKNGIVMNLEYVNKDIARRVIDTVSGAVTALDGRIEKVSNSIFVVAPNNYDITNEPISREKNERTQAPWVK